MEEKQPFDVLVSYSPEAEKAMKDIHGLDIRKEIESLIRSEYKEQEDGDDNGTTI
jgi:hypothetical protein